MAGHMSQQLLNHGLGKVIEDVELVTKGLTIEKGFLKQKVDKQQAPGRCRKLCQFVVMALVFGPMVLGFLGIKIGGDQPQQPPPRP